MAVMVIVIAFAVLKMQHNAKYLALRFKKNNCIVFGRKRKGKDLLFQKMVNVRDEPYIIILPNKTEPDKMMTYGGDCIVLNLKDLTLFPNTYKNLIDGNVQQVKRDDRLEKRDIYYPDGSVYTPSQYFKMLDARYPSLPLFLTVIGHLYDTNFHSNYNGSFGRLWDKIREQGDYFIKALGTIKIFGVFFSKYRLYEEYNSAELGLLPYQKARIFRNKIERAEYKLFTATNGLIKDMWIVQLKVNIHYDTRYFKRVFFSDIKDMEDSKIFDIVETESSSVDSDDGGSANVGEND